MTIVVPVRYKKITKHGNVAKLNGETQTGYCLRKRDRIVTVATSIAQKVKRNVLPQHLDTRHLFLYTSELIPSILANNCLKRIRLKNRAVNWLKPYFTG